MLQATVDALQAKMALMETQMQSVMLELKNERARNRVEDANVNAIYAQNKPQNVQFDISRNSASSETVTKLNTQTLLNTELETQPAPELELSDEEPEIQVNQTPPRQFLNDTYFENDNTPVQEEHTPRAAPIPSPRPLSGQDNRLEQTNALETGGVSVEQVFSSTPANNQTRETDVPVPDGNALRNEASNTSINSHASTATGLFP